MGVVLNDHHELDVNLIRRTIGYFPPDIDPEMEAWEALSSEERAKRIKITIEKTRPLIRSLLGPIPKEFLLANKNPLA